MIYLHRVPTDDSSRFDIAVCECEERAQALEAQGYKRCPYALYRRLWALQDRWALEAMREEAVAAPLVRVDDAPKTARVVRVGYWTLPEGYRAP